MGAIQQQASHEAPGGTPAAAVPRGVRQAQEEKVTGVASPDLTSQEFSCQNGCFFVQLCIAARKEEKEAEETVKALGFDEFHWFEVEREVASKWHVDDIEDTQGFVAANDDAIVVIFRSTTSTSVSDWISNLKIFLRNVPESWGVKDGGVHTGFDNGVESVWSNKRATNKNKPGMLNVIRGLYIDATKKGTPRKLFLAGHSMGGALAIIAGARLAYEEDIEISAVYTTGAPRVFNRDMAKHFDAKINFGTPLKAKCFRGRNNNDMVPRVPTGPSFAHIGTQINFDRNGRLGEPSFLDHLRGRWDSLKSSCVFFDGIEDHAAEVYLRIYQQAWAAGVHGTEEGSG